jgi:hypothetical protein
MTEFVNMKADLDKLTATLFETGKFRKLCEDMQTLKKSIMLIVDCKVLEPFHVKAREHYCYNG